MAALHTAVKRGDLQSVKELVRTNKSLLNERDEQRRCVLHIAAASPACGVELLDFLLSKSKKLDVNTQDLSGWTPLHCATSKGLYEIILHLLSLKNVKPSLLNEERNTPFHNLCKLTLDTSSGSEDVFQFYRCLTGFVARSIDINEQNKSGDSALHCATRCGNVEAVDFLCRRGALINVVNKNGETPLSLAVMGRRPENVRTLLEFGARLEFGGHTYASLDQAAALPLTKNLLNEIFTVQYVIEQKMKELDGMKRELRRDLNMTEELERTMRKEKKSSAPSRIPLRSGVGTLRSKPQKSLTSTLQMCERFDNRFYIARSGVWTCCAKRIEFSNVPLANKRSTQLQFLGELQHHHLLPVLSVSNEQTHVRVFTEWAPSNLRKLLHQMRSRLEGRPFLALSEIVRLAKQIAEPLEYLHSHKIVCRCVKIDQLFVGQKSADKHSSVPSLLLPLYYSSRCEDLWSVPEAPGNDDYYEPAFSLATETRFNSLSYPFSADVWAFGTVLYEIMTGKPPYAKVAPEKISEYMKMQSPVLPQGLRARRNKSSNSLASSTSSEEATSPSSSTASAPPSETYKLIVNLIEACTELDAMKRPTMSEVVYSLANYRDIGEVMRKKLHKQPIKDELPKTALPHQGEWPADPNRLPFHVLPHQLSSSLIQGGAGYVVETPLDIKSTTNNPVVLQFEDNCVPYYKNLISSKMHDNFMGVLSSSPEDPDRFAVISISSEPTMASSGHEYRAIVRTISGDDRIIVACDHPKDRIKALKQHPLVSPYKLTLIKDPSVTRQLVDFEASQMEARAFKFGVIYRRKGQSTDNEMYSNRKGSPAFHNFLRFLGSFVLLKGWDGFRGGLDVCSDTTGTQSVYATTGREQIMFHVSTLLPYDEDNPQQLHRKRHIGNDIVVIIFQDADAGPFSPAKWASNFNHVFVVIQEVEEPAGQRNSLNRSSGLVPTELDLEPMDVMADAAPSTRYQVSVAYKDSIAIHPRPFLREPCTFVADSDFHHFLLSKLINGERVAMRSKNFAGKMKAVRRQYLSDIVE